LLGFDVILGFDVALLVPAVAAPALIAPAFSSTEITAFTIPLSAFAATLPFSALAITLRITLQQRSWGLLVLLLSSCSISDDLAIPGVSIINGIGNGVNDNSAEARSTPATVAPSLSSTPLSSLAAPLAASTSLELAASAATLGCALQQWARGWPTQAAQAAQEAVQQATDSASCSLNDTAEGWSDTADDSAEGWGEATNDSAKGRG